MKIASYNSHRSAPFLRALVERTTKFTRSKGADAVIPSASPPASYDLAFCRVQHTPAIRAAATTPPAPHRAPPAIRAFAETFDRKMPAGTPALLNTKPAPIDLLLQIGHVVHR